MDFVNDGRKSSRKLLRVRIPVADFGFVSVVDLKNICKVADVGKSFEIAQNDFFVDILIVVVPRRVASKMVNPTRAFLRILGKIRVENAVVSAVYVHKVKQFVFAVNRQSLNVFLHRKYVFFHIRIENRIARALVERTYKLYFFVLAEVSICEAVVQIFAVFGESVIARHTREFSNYRQFGQRAQTVLHVAFLYSLVDVQDWKPFAKNLSLFSK